MECPVCFEIYKDPLLLPGCGHTICAECAEQLVQEGNYLRCPECRLIYQLRRGVKSLPKNVALRRTIDEHNRVLAASAASAGGVTGVKCDVHREDIVSLYCKTCEKAICLKCFFSSTIRKDQPGGSLHAGHQVDTSEDVSSRERRLLEEKCREWEKRQQAEMEHILRLEEAEASLKKLLEEKLACVEANKAELISHVKQTSAKLRFTLQGTVAGEVEHLHELLQSARSRLAMAESVVIDVMTALNQTSSETCPEIDILKAARKKLDGVVHPTLECPKLDSLSKIELFDTDIRKCLTDPKKALSYQTEVPRVPTLCSDKCIISDTCAYIPIEYNEVIRINRLCLYVKEAIYKGLSEKDWDHVDTVDIRQGQGTVKLTGLKRGTMYKAYAVASNECGDSAQSSELWFRTVDNEIERRLISK